MKFLTILGGVATFIGIVFLLMTFTIIEQTERGVLTNFGQVTGTLEPGFHMINPFTENVHRIDVSVQALEVQELSYSKDTQIVDVQATVNYQLNSNEVEKLFTEVRTDAESRYVIPRTKEALKNIFAKYNAQGIIDNRSQLTSEIKIELVNELSGLGITVQDVLLTNLDFDDAYENAVQRKQVAEQEALAQENITKSEEEKKKQEILKAEALAEKTRLEAQALASSQGQQVIEKIYAEAQLEASKKWNGQLPTNMYGSVPLPLINIDN